MVVPQVEVVVVAKVHVLQIAEIVVKATPIGHQHHAMALVKMRASQGAKHHV